MSKKLETTNRIVCAECKYEFDTLVYPGYKVGCPQCNNSCIVPGGENLQGRLKHAESRGNDSCIVPGGEDLEHGRNPMRIFGIVLLVIGLIILPFGILPGALVAIVGLLMMIVGKGKSKEETAGAPPKDIAGKIKEIDDLKEQGTITQEEYETRRKAILNSDT